MVAEQAVQQREPARLIEVDESRTLGHQPLTDHEVPEEPAFLGQADFGAVGELSRAPQVVHESGRQEQVRVQPGVLLGDLDGERRHRHRVLEQPPEIRVMPRPRAGRAAPRRTQLAVAQQRLEQRPVATVVDLASEMLEKAVELVEVAVGDRQEPGRIDVLRSAVTTIGANGAGDIVDLDDRLVAEALDPPANPHEIAAVEPAGQHVRVAERSRGDRPGAIAKLEREVCGAGSGYQPILARAPEDAADLGARPQPTDGDRPTARPAPVVFTEVMCP